MIKKVYLAGPIAGVEDPMSWRRLAEKKLPIDWQAINPLLIETQGMKPHQLVATDLRAVLQCRAILAKVTQPSWGTAMELFHATQNGIPVVGWGHPNVPSPWLLHCCRAIFADLQQVMKWLGDLK